MAVDTRTVANRRQLHFDTPADILADVERLNQGPVKALGNWSGGQVLKHLALVMHGSIDGIPTRPPWVMRVLGRMLKKRVLRKGMPPGYRLPPEAAQALVPPATSWDEGLAVFRQAVQRLQTEAHREPSPFLGPMTREDWDQLHCRHAELHLSFLLPAAG
jgi:hypothetical protein